MAAPVPCTEDRDAEQDGGVRSSGDGTGWRRTERVGQDGGVRKGGTYGKMAAPGAGRGGASGGSRGAGKRRRRMEDGERLL